MTDRSWMRLYVPLVIAAGLLCTVFFSRISLVHAAAIVVLLVALPPALAYLGGWFGDQPTPEPPRDTPPARLALLATIAFLLAAAKFAIVGMLSSQFIPTLHDEWSYLFGAQTMALGRIANPTPPLAEFFDTFHILTAPQWVSRYPPGHAAALVPGIWLGVPAVMVVALNAGTVVWGSLVADRMGGFAAAVLAAILLTLAPGMDYLAGGYLSQTTFLFTVMGCLSCSVFALERGSAGWAAAAGVLGGWSILTRPYSAAAIGVPLALWFLRHTWCVGLWRGQSVDRGTGRAANPLVFKLEMTVTAGIPIVIALGLLGIHNAATTRSVWRTAWGEYNRQYEPANTLGFARGVERPDAAQPLPAHKKSKAESIFNEKGQYTWREALRRALAESRRVSEMGFPAVGFYGLLGFIPFVYFGGESGPMRRRVSVLLAAALAAHYAAYTFFYSSWGVYGHETIPFVTVLVAGGIVEFWRRARDSDRPMLAGVVPLVLAATLVFDGVELSRFVARRRDETRPHRDFRDKVRQIERHPAVVFVHSDPTRAHPYDFVNNTPDLDAAVLVVRDLGDRNREFLEGFPARQPYRYDESNGSLSPWMPPATELPPRSPGDAALPPVSSSP